MKYTIIENKRFGEKYYKFRHKSGLKIIVCPKKDFTSSYALIGTKFGSINSEFINNGRKIKVPDGTAQQIISRSLSVYFSTLYSPPISHLKL